MDEAQKNEVKVAIREWLQLDSDMHALRTELRAKSKQQKEITAVLLNIMKGHNIDGFNVQDGSLVYKTSKVRQPLNAKLLNEAMNAYFPNDTPTADDLVKHILNRRPEKIKERLLRKRKALD